MSEAPRNTDYSARPRRDGYAPQRHSADSTRMRSGNSPQRSAAQTRSRSAAYDARRNGGARASSEPPRRPQPPVKRPKEPLARIIPLALIAIVLIVLYQFGSAWLITTTNSDTYCSNIYVNGIDVSPYGKEEGAQYVQEQINARLNTSYTLTMGGQNWSFTAADFGGEIQTGDMMERAWNLGHVGNMFDCKKAIQALNENPIHLNAELTYDENLVDAFVDEIYEALYVAPIDATVVVDQNNPILASPSVSGQELDRDGAREQIIALIETGEGARELPMRVLEPALSTENAMNEMELIVEYKTDTSARNYNSRFNVRKALDKFYGMRVEPGQTVNFNEVVGPRTEQRGWKSAIEYSGNTTVEGFGGGVCQASSTLYGAMMKAGMTIIERKPHGMTVTYVEPSIDAAVTETNKNLIFRNDTDSTIYIYTEVTKEFATVRVYGKRPEYRYELESEIVAQEAMAVHVEYIDDVDGKFVYYTHETKLYKKGHPACSSNGWLIAYDWETGEEVKRTQISHDEYKSGTDVYVRGVHDATGAVVTSAPTDANQ